MPAINSQSQKETHHDSHHIVSSGFTHDITWFSRASCNKRSSSLLEVEVDGWREGGKRLTMDDISSYVLMKLLCVCFDVVGVVLTEERKRRCTGVVFRRVHYVHVYICIYIYIMEEKKISVLGLPIRYLIRC